MDGRNFRRTLEDRLESFPGGLLNFSVWLASVACVVAILSSRVAHVEYLGLANAVEHEVSVATPGVLAGVLVGMYEDVEEGELIAVLDDRQVAASLALASAQLSILKGQLDAASSGSSSTAAVSAATVDWMSEQRRYEMDVENRRLDALSLEVELETDRVEEHRLRLKLRRAEPLHDEGAISLDQYDDIRFRHATVVKRIDGNTLLLDRTKQELTRAIARRDAYVGGTDGDEASADAGYLALLKSEIALQEKRVEEIAVARASLSLRAPVDGRIAFLGARIGQAVDVGEAVAVVARTDSTQVQAWLPEGDARELEQGQRVWVRGASNTRLAESFIERVAPTISLMPTRLWHRPDMPEYGRAVVVAAVDGLDLTPGESVRVRFY